MTQPLLIGGATTSPAHTAVKIDPVRSNGPTVHVTDASRAVGVVSTLLSETDRPLFLETTQARYQRMREARAGGPPKPRLTLDKAREKRFVPTTGPAPAPAWTGVRVFDEIDLADLARFIDWTPYFASWNLAGRFPSILEDAVVGEAASDLWRDTQAMLQKVIGQTWFRPRAVVGFWPATRDGDDIRLDSGETFHTLRQQMVKDNGRANFALSDFIAEQNDHVGGFAVTAGPEADTLASEFEAKGDDYSAIMVKALADRFAEAMAEYMHMRVRRELWAYAPDETLDNEALIKETYQGIRPAPGYPCQPDHTEKETLFRLLDAGQIGMSLTSSFAMSPAASVSGLYLAHPESAYFAVGRIEPDQVADYAKRKGMSLREAERWLGPILNYDPDEVRALADAVA
jgi:5-methyltetrahydrofolate--homocysteine methyltransferase